MSLLDLLVTPGVAIGCVIGVALASAVHLMFPDKDLVAFQALIIVVACVLGLIWEGYEPPNK